MNIDKQYLNFVRDLNASSIQSEEERKYFLRLKYFEYLDEFELENTVNIYQMYRSLCRGVYGIDLIKERPINKIDPIETQMDLFQSKEKYF